MNPRCIPARALGPSGPGSPRCGSRSFRWPGLLVLLACLGCHRPARIPERATLCIPHHQVLAAAYSPDGTTLAWKTERVDGDRVTSVTVMVWDLAAHQLRATLPQEPSVLMSSSLAFAPDGPTLASAGFDGTVILYQAASYQRRAIFRGPWKPGPFPDWISGDPTGVAFSPDGRTLAVGTALGDGVPLWDVRTGKVRTRLKGPPNTVNGLAFSPDGQTLATGGSDYAVRLWDPATGRLRATLPGQANAVLCVAFTPDGQTLAAGNVIKSVTLWDPVTGTERDRLTAYTRPVQSLAFSPNGKILATSSANEVTLWDWGRRTVLATGRGQTQQVTCVLFAPDGQTLVSTSLDGTVKFWDVSGF